MAAALLLPLLFFHRAAFSADIFIARDILRVYYPLKQYWAERVLQGSLPAWYPYNALGQPYAAMVISGSFHPANLLYLVLPTALALKLTVLACFVVALGGTYRFARSWSLRREPALFSGLTYALGGYLVGLTNNLLYLMAAATLPWALWAAGRFLHRPDARRAALAAVLLALILLSGEPQSFALCCAAVLGLGLLRPRRTRRVHGVGRAGLLVGLAVLLSMVQLVPVLALRSEARATAATLQAATAFSFHPLRLLELALGPLFLDPLTQEVVSFELAKDVLSGRQALWVGSVHLGAPALLLLGVALWHHRRRALTGSVAGLALLVLALAMARQLPLYGWLYAWLPGWNIFRSPEKLLPWFLFACALGAGVGLQRVLRSPSAAAHGGRVALGLAVLCAGGVLWEWGGRVFSHGVIGALWARPVPEVQELLRGNVMRGGVAAGVAFALTGGVLLGWRRARAPRAWALLLVQFLALYAANEPVYQVSSPELLDRPPEMLRLIAAESPSDESRPRVYGGAPELRWHAPIEGLRPIDIRSLHVTETLWPDVPALWGVESAMPYLPAASRRASGLLTLEEGPLRLPPPRVLDLFGVRYLTASAWVYRSVRGKPEAVVAELERFDELLLRNPGALSRAYLAAPVCVPDENAALALLFSRDFTPGTQVALECPPGTAGADARGAPEGPPGRVRFARDEPEEVILDVESPTPTVLVLNDAWFPGWSATVDGEPVPLLPANVAVRGVRVPAGTHQVVFSFHAPGQGLGALLTLLTLGGLGVAMLVPPRRRECRMP